ncbi:MAG: class I SAM-dependent methyltransferase [Sedimentisphaerales bacterium]|nr:class I SAM-dependent methyltransferase [Sedimentisphaerales bacterium]
MNSNKEIDYNINAHNRIAAKYERIHDEIFNDIEQARVHNALEEAIRAIESGKEDLKALDVGCGSGNLTRHLIDHGLYTVSADVSENFLKLIKQKFASTSLSKTLKLNGLDLADIDDCSFDIAAAYSVLHHVPDYLHLVKEMCRVLKPGGIIYIDHEACQSRYSKPPEYVEFLNAATPKSYILWKYVRLLLSFRFYVNFIKKRINPRFIGEGDIHVWPDDHIEWDKIQHVLSAQNFEIITRKDYLVCRNSYIESVYEAYKHKCCDTTMLIARKKAESPANT